MVNLNKKNGGKLKMNNWTKFFLADALLSFGAWGANSGSVFLGVFGILGGAGIIISLIFSVMEE